MVATRKRSGTRSGTQSRSACNQEGQWKREDERLEAAAEAAGATFATGDDLLAALRAAQLALDPSAGAARGLGLFFRASADAPPLPPPEAPNASALSASAGTPAGDIMHDMLEGITRVEHAAAAAAAPAPPAAAASKRPGNAADGISQSFTAAAAAAALRTTLGGVALPVRAWGLLWKPTNKVLAEDYRKGEAWGPALAELVAFKDGGEYVSKTWHGLAATASVRFADEEEQAAKLHADRNPDSMVTPAADRFVAMARAGTTPDIVKRVANLMQDDAQMYLDGNITPLMLYVRLTGELFRLAGVSRNRKRAQSETGSDATWLRWRMEDWAGAAWERGTDPLLAEPEASVGRCRRPPPRTETYTGKRGR